MFDWNNTFLFGIEEIDMQHKHLYEIGAEIHHLMTNFSGQECFDEITAAIANMVHYVILHNDTEERLFAEYGYPGAAEHEWEHRLFIDYLNSKKLEHIGEDQEGALNELLQFIDLWYFKHMGDSDLKYKEFLLSKMNR